MAFVSLSGPPRISAYDGRWAAAAHDQLDLIRAALTGDDEAHRPAALVLDHIGSTAVPGLAAKPVLDLQLRVHRLNRDRQFETRLSAAGYRATAGSRPDSPGVMRDAPRGAEDVDPDVWAKLLLIRPHPEQPAILHVRQLASPWGRYTVLFRDWLRAHPSERARYQELKLRLAAEHAGDPDCDDYTRAKIAYFDEVQPAFEQWGAAAEHRPV